MAAPDGPVTLTHLDGTSTVVPKFPSNLRPGPPGSGTWYLPGGQLVTISPVKAASGKTTGVKVKLGSDPVVGPPYSNPRAPSVKTPAPLPNPDQSLIDAINKGGDVGTGQGGTQQDTEYKQALGALTKQLNGTLSQDFSVPYDQVQANFIGSPFGEKGYQPNTKLENAILSDELGRMGNNSIGSFLPEGARTAAALYAPYLASQRFAGAQQANTIQGYNQGANYLLNQIPGQISQDFNNSIGLQHQLDRGVMQSIQAQNPNNANLLPAGAPQSQVNEINSGNKSSFGGGGAVLNGLGELNSSSLAAQRASALAGARELPALNTLAGRQALVASLIANNSNLAKIGVDEGKSALQIAQENMGANKAAITADSALHRDLTNTDAKYIAQQIGIDEHNASAAQAAAATNAASHLSAIRAATSNRNAAINQARFSLSVLKAAYPKQSATQTASQGKAAQAFFSSAVYGKVTSPGASGASFPIRGTKLTYEEAVRQWATSHGGDAQVASTLAGGYYNYGQGGVPGPNGVPVGYRPLDPAMQNALQKSGAYTDLHFTQDGHFTPFLTQDQLVALTKTNDTFVRSVVTGGVKQNISMKDALAEGLVSPQQAAANPNATIAAWSVPAYGSDPNKG